MLDIHNLHATIGDKKVLNGLHLHVNAGEVHAIMGPNGAGKSTLAAILAGREAYTVTSGHVSFHGQDLLALAPEARAARGLFLAFQYPIEIPGVTTANFLKTALNQIRKQNEQPLVTAVDFLALLKAKMALLHMDPTFAQRSLNQGFSGGEKKRNEMLQMLLLNPTLAILDETDSGLDIDALKTISQGINQFRNSQNTLILITHYQRLLDYVVPDFVHVLYEGQIIRSGTSLLAKTLEQEGYAWASENKQCL